MSVESVRGLFYKEELEAAASIGAQSTDAKSKVQELFATLSDPLLSESDLVFLLGSVAVEDIRTALAALVAEGALEKSTQTLRPLDPEGIELYRSADVPFARLKLFALEAELGDGSKRYQFTCDGRLIRSVARVDRLDAIAGSGNQRDEIKTHVNEIAAGIRSGTQVPNSILLVLKRDLTVENPDEPPPNSFIILRPIQDQPIVVNSPSDDTRVIQRLRSVEIDMPYRKAAFDEEKAAVLVDGQQRTAALSMVDVDEVPSFALSVNAVVADDDDAKRVFQVANSTAKIATQFSRALLATMGESPGYMKEEKVLALAVKMLAIAREDSPFYHLVQYPGVSSERRPPVAYNSIFQVVSEFYNSALKDKFDDDAKLLADVVARAFDIVRVVWPAAWGKKPTQSRLMHGIGLRGLASLLVSKLEARFPEYDNLLADGLWEETRASIRRLQPKLVWSETEAAEASLATRKTWREQIINRQNTNQDISAFSHFLKKECLALDTKAKKEA